MYKVFVKTDETGRVISVNSDTFIPDITGWERIDEGEGDRFPRNYLVYVHTNKENGKRYVGITRQNIKYRWRSDGSGYFRSPYFYNAILKCGWDNFEHDILADNLTKQEAVDMEKKCIKEYKTQDRLYGYNVTAGGDGTSEYTIPKESVERRAAMMRGIPKSDEQRRKISESNKGKRPSEKTIEKLRVSHLGHKNTEKQMDALRIGWEYGKKPVYSIDENGNRTDYCSTSEAARAMNFNHLQKNFKRIVDNHHKSCGCYWYYKEVS